MSTAAPVPEPDFADILHEAMGGMTQAELSDLSGLRQPTIARYLNRERKPNYAARIALEKALPRLRDLLVAA
jgi:transcriptional regulator with XRE-family HTH domain